MVVVSHAKPQQMNVYHFKKGTEICNYSYSSNILSIRLNRQVRGVIQSYPTLLLCCCCLSSWEQPGEACRETIGGVGGLGACPLLPVPPERPLTGAGEPWVSSATSVSFRKMKPSPCFGGSYTKAFCHLPSCPFRTQLCQKKHLFIFLPSLGFHILTSGASLPSWLQMRPSKLVTKTQE